jgi:hypothetical protein
VTKEILEGCIFNPRSGSHAQARRAAQAPLLAWILAHGECYIDRQQTMDRLVWEENREMATVLHEWDESLQFLSIEVINEMNEGVPPIVHND